MVLFLFCFVFLFFLWNYVEYCSLAEMERSHFILQLY